VPCAPFASVLCAAHAGHARLWLSGVSSRATSRRLVRTRRHRRPVVFCVDGVGNFGATSVSLGGRSTRLACRCTFKRSSGRKATGASSDHMDHCHARNEDASSRAIGVLPAPRADGPRCCYLVAHSGAAPWHCADGVLPPSRGADRPAGARRVGEYDLRPALRCARLGVDVFHSQRRDLLAWRMASSDGGSALDRAAGRVFFGRRGRLARCGAVLNLSASWARVSAGPQQGRPRSATTSQFPPCLRSPAAFRTGSVKPPFPYLPQVRGRSSLATVATGNRREPVVDGPDQQTSVLTSCGNGIMMLHLARGGGTEEVRKWKSWLRLPICQYNEALALTRTFGSAAGGCC